ncbi:bile acid:sodium symporter family protein [Pelagicoccus sp. SDUM812005]|uniref:bile acid:sodium symporter family protein n=1 Tax=Pelagicoccus sp. SDUM812005 TaxID=3041257 RepID=UPI00280D4559|nr:bile acid:sodium symporter family protein [Pelagicoccus sp. SDUM812005]MDQ8181670.1 bile acid:sodium symporter [Pelagicoccus sp. SDUM812005]
MPIQLRKFKAATRGHGFTLALLGVALAAFAYPSLGNEGGPLHPELTTKVAVALTFLVQGLFLPTRQIAASATKFRLHGFCQIAIFLLAPACMLCLLLVSGSWIQADLRAGFLFLSALPTTISSAIVMTANSEGDSSAALFSTTCSNVLGIFATPALCAALLSSSITAELPLLPLIGKLSLLVLLPLLLGQAIRPFVRDWAQGSKVLFKRLSNGFVLYIVYSAFCGSFASGVWQTVASQELLGALLLTFIYLLSFSAIVWLASPLASQQMPERIAAFFCGSQKTLAAGVPMAALIFAGGSDGVPAPSLGLVILPLLCYHALQLFLAGVLSPVFAKKVVAA